MKTTFKLLATAAGAAMLLVSPTLQAESTYGYNAAGAAGATATARVNINVTVPTLILLRVGSNADTVDTVTLAVQPTPGIPGGVASPLTAGNSQASGWDGTAPIMAAVATPATLTAFAWTNSAGGGNVTGAVTTAFPAASGLTAADILVTNGGTGTLAHPGANTGTFTPTTFARNTVVSSTWAYSLSAAGLANAAAGSPTQLVTYTATAL
jgi:hypothetical protein